MGKRAIGIDFGTTKTLVSFFNDKTKRPELVRLGRGTDYIPTSVYASEDGSFLYGEEADDHMEFDASRYCRAFKMKLGTSNPALLFFNKTQPVSHSAQELVQFFLQHVKKRVEEEVFMGESISKVVITKPVLFSPIQCEELEQAAQSAGFSDVMLVTEPEAAGLAFCSMSPSEAFTENALIIDWGGGTLDVALVSRQGGEVFTHRQYTNGDMTMGGEIFDERLWNHVCLHLSEKGLALQKEPPERQGSLLKRLRQAKEILSNQEQYTLRLSSSQGPCPPVTLKRECFESLIRPDVEHVSGLTQQLMANIQEKSLKPELLLLVGGSAQIPLIAHTMEQEIGLPCKKWQFSREAVSLGASLFTSNYLEEEKQRKKIENEKEEVVKKVVENIKESIMSTAKIMGGIIGVLFVWLIGALTGGTGWWFFGGVIGYGIGYVIGCVIGDIAGGNIGRIVNLLVELIKND